VVRELDGSNLRALYSEKVAQPFDWSPTVGPSRSSEGVRRSGNQLVLISTSDGSVRVLREVAAAGTC